MAEIVSKILGSNIYKYLINDISQLWIVDM